MGSTQGNFWPEPNVVRNCYAYRRSMRWMVPELLDGTSATMAKESDIWGGHVGKLLVDILCHVVKENSLYWQTAFPSLL